MKQQTPALSAQRLLPLILAIITTGQLFTACKSNSYHDELETAATELNKQYPTMIDEITRIDSVSVGEGKEMRYHYTLVQTDATKVDTAQLAVVMEPMLLGSINENLQLKQFRDKDVELTYIYNDMNGRQLFRHTFTSKEYKK